MRLFFAFALLFLGSAYGATDKNASSEEDTVPDSNNNIKWLTEISHTVTNPNYVDITLPRESFGEECYMLEDGQLVSTDSLELSGVTIQSRSNYVSCRITIGPMTEDLAGTWELCGKSVSNGEVRCQRAVINFEGFAPLVPIIETKHVHPVHFGGSVNSGVSGLNNVSGLNTCHVVTPAGEDLVINSNVNYPHIERSSPDIANLCSVVIKDITRDMLGDWDIYGRFINPQLGVREIRLPLAFELYNEDDPYEQAYNVTALQAQEHSVRAGRDLSVQVDQAVGVVEDCIFTSPTGKTFSTKNSANVPSGVYISSSDSEAVCEIHFSGITDDMEGQWQIFGKFRNGVLFDEKRLTITIVVEDLLLSQINHFTMQQAVIDISLSKQSFDEDCYVRPPNSNMIKAELVDMPGVKVQQKSQFVSCRITIGPMTQDLLGAWRLCGRSIASQEIRCQPVVFAWQSTNGRNDSRVTNRPAFTHPVHFGGSVHTGVSDSADVNTCHVITPAGEDLVITTDANYPHIERRIIAHSTVVCSIVFMDITRDMLGNWLIYGYFRSPLLGLIETRFPITFRLYNEDDPYDQAYNVTELPRQNILIHVGTNLSRQVTERTGVTEDCIYTSPTGQIISINDKIPNVPNGVYINSSKTGALCDIAFSPITKEVVGEWQISAKFINGAFYNENRLRLNIIEEDPENPFPDDVERDISYLEHRLVVVDMNNTNRIALGLNRVSLVVSCHLITPSGRQYAFIDGFNVPHVEITPDSGTDCGIILSVDDESVIGNWTIFSRGTRTFPSGNVERRLPITIRGEEHFLLQNDIHIRQGADLYLHLHDVINVTETCKLFGPDGEEFTEYETDPIHENMCGYIVRNVNDDHSGSWIIEYGKIIKVRGHVDVKVIDSQNATIGDMRWSVGDPINMSVGPKDAVYCIIRDSRGNRIFDAFGQCKIKLERVNADHAGFWMVQIGKPGMVRLQTYSFSVNVRTRDGRPVVTTIVKELYPSIMLTCSVPVEHEVHACEFRDSRSNNWVAAHGVGQDGYMFNGTVSNYMSGSDSHDCTLRIINATIWDMGIWRCGLDTSSGTHFGFLTVASPRVIETSEERVTVITEPVLRDTSHTHVDGEPVTLSCSIPAAIRYCYFRADNGTIYNVFPRMPSTANFEYVGAGLDAGECGIKFNRFTSDEYIYWTCHVGLMNSTELSRDVYAIVTPQMTVHHYWEQQETVIVQGIVYRRNALDYCRFVKMNGQGFISDNLPYGYEMISSLREGDCSMRILYPDVTDFQPWTVIAKLTRDDGEISMVTRGIRFEQRRNLLAETFFWLMIAFICLIPLVALIAFIPKKNREWTSTKANRLRRSFRNSWSKAFAKKHAAQQDLNLNSQNQPSAL